MERTMMLGTDRGLDYLIVAKRGESALGIKPLVSITKPHGVIFMVRVRATFAPSATQPTKAKGLDFKALWPELKWENVDSHRVSVIVAVPSGLWPWQHKGLTDRAIGAFAAIIDRFNEEGLKLDHDLEDVAQFVFESWGKEIALFEECFPPHPEKSPEEPYASYETELYPRHEESMTAAQVSKKASGLFTAIEGGKSDGPYTSPKKSGHLKLVGDLPETEEIDEEAGEEDDGDGDNSYSNT
jgi:hypothetical protein